MRNTHEENIQEHSLQVAMIAHLLALIHNKFYGGRVDIERVLTLAVFHEASEVITGDLATPIKYFNPEIKKAYKDIEEVANKKLLEMLPKELQEDYDHILIEKKRDKRAYAFVKAADKLCAYLKCLEELKAGNGEFEKAKNSIEGQIHEMNMPEIAYFMKNFAPSFSLTLDELN
jgi:5'-deoxynucleotidase